MKKKIVTIGILVVVCVGAALIGDVFPNKEEVSRAPLSVNKTFLNGTSTVPALRDGWKEYRNSKYSFYVTYPGDLLVEEFSEGISASTIVFEHPTEPIGFQIFVVPYTEAQIDIGRIKQDIPSGVVKNEARIKIGGATGVAFESKDELLGDTVEIWFVHDGHLYEITALLKDMDWLVSLLSTWRFET